MEHYKEWKYLSGTEKCFQWKIWRLQKFVQYNLNAVKNECVCALVCMCVWRICNSWYFFLKEEIIFFLKREYPHKLLQVGKGKLRGQ
jgi:hypothetical protein